ncbi:ABC transporter permease [Mycoplasma sp. 4013]
MHKYADSKFASFMESTRRFFMFEEKKNTRTKIYSSLWAIFFGLLIASVFYMILGRSGQNGRQTGLFTFITYVFTFAFDSLNQKYLLLYLIFFGFAGIGVSIGFKSGLFNIGAANQMTTPAIIFFAVLILSRTPVNKISVSYLVIMLFIFVIVAFIMGALSGLLKAYLNVHEVISTIFFNWIIAYLAQYLFKKDNGAFGTGLEPWFDQIQGTTQIFISETVTYNFIYAGLVLLGFFAVLIWYIYAKTSIGYKIKMVGLNKTNAKYVGINEKMLTVMVMGLSGAFIGFAGFYYIVLQRNSLEASNSPIVIGFDSIAIALIALNSPIGVILSAFLYSLLYTSETFFQAIPQGSEAIREEFFMLIYGIIIFIASLSLIFYKFKPFRWLFKQSYLITNKEYWKEFKKYYQQKFSVFVPNRFKLVNKWFEGQKLKRAFAKTEKDYQNNVAQRIIASKDFSNEQLMQMYDELSKIKFQHNAQKEVAGLNIYRDLLGKHKNEVKMLKNNFKHFQEELFLTFIKKIKDKYFKTFKIKEEVA